MVRGLVAEFVTPHLCRVERSEVGRLLYIVLSINLNKELFGLARTAFERLRFVIYSAYYKSSDRCFEYPNMFIGPIQ